MSEANPVWRRADAIAQRYQFGEMVILAKFRHGRVVHVRIPHKDIVEESSSEETQKLLDKSSVIT